MPEYEFVCRNCYKGFSKVLFQDDYEEGTLICPYCGSDRVELRASNFTTRNKKSA